MTEGLSLSAICRELGISKATVVNWANYDTDGFAERYARAREALIDGHDDEILQIADTPELSPDEKRVRIDARKWLLSKLRAKKFGDKLDATIDGKLTVNIVRFSDGAE
jgi:transposase